jgi:hypothetical protein
MGASSSPPSRPERELLLSRSGCLTSTLFLGLCACISGLLTSLAGSVAEWYGRGLLLPWSMLGVVLGFPELGLTKGADATEEADALQGHLAMVLPLFLTISTSWGLLVT